MAQWSLTSASNYFKTKFGPLSEATYNSANVLLGRVKKNYKFTGDIMTVPVPTKFSGGVGSGTLPAPNASNPVKMTITAKSLYAVVKIQRQAIKASLNDEGAYLRLMKEAASSGVESYMRNLSRAMLNSLANGSLGSFSGSSAGTASAPIITVTAGTWKEANWEEGDYLNVNTDNSVFEVTAVVPSTREVTLARISGSLDLTSIGAGTHVTYMQNSKDNDPESIIAVLMATSGSKYNVAITRRFQAAQEDLNGAAISVDLINKVMLEVERRSGKVPNLIICSFVQLRKLLALSENQKQYPISPRDERLKGKLSFNGVEFMSTRGAIPIVAERFCDDDKVLLLNDDFIEIHHRPDFGWFDDDGTIFLREAGEDSYSARYGGYLEVVIVPSFHGILYECAV